MLDKYPNIALTIIPKNGTYGNDASWSDVLDLLTLDIFNKLNLYEEGMRFSICKSGPSMGVINLRKLSGVAVDIIEDANPTCEEEKTRDATVQNKKPTIDAATVLPNIPSPTMS